MSIENFITQVLSLVFHCRVFNAILADSTTTTLVKIYQRLRRDDRDRGAIVHITARFRLIAAVIVTR